MLEYKHLYETVCVFKQKTAYVMRISDWSANVCSSDLANSTKSAWPTSRRRPQRRTGKVPRSTYRRTVLTDTPRQLATCSSERNCGGLERGSDRRRGRKECGSTDRSRVSPYRFKQNRDEQEHKISNNMQEKNN